MPFTLGRLAGQNMIHMGLGAFKFTCSGAFKPLSRSSIRF